jgi:hypothetical protein
MALVVLVVLAVLVVVLVVVAVVWCGAGASPPHLPPLAPSLRRTLSLHASHPSNPLGFPAALVPIGEEASR